MRIMHILPGNGRDGIGRHILTLSTALQEAGHEVLFIGRRGAWITEECRRTNIPVEIVKMRGLFDFSSVLALRKLAKKWQADILHGHSTRGAYFAGLAAWRTSMAALATVHSTKDFKYMRRCRHLLAVSGAVKDNLIKKGHQPAKITVVHNGMPESKPLLDRAALRSELGMPPAALSLVCVGRFSSEKGQDLLVKAMHRIKTDVHLYLIGDYQTDFGTMVQEMAKGDPRIHFLGYREDGPALLRAFDLYVSPSRREAFSLALIEAASAGLPIIAFHVGGNPEILVHKESGFLVEPENVNKLADAIEQLTEQNEVRLRLGQHAYLRYKELFTIKHMLTQTVSCYQKLLTEAKR